MNIRELIEALEEIAEDFPDAEVSLATQPDYPFENSIGEVVGIVEEDGTEKVIIGVEKQIGCLSPVAAAELGWQ